MYLPKSKYKVETVKPGQFTLNGEDYAGAILKDYKGNVYAGDSPTNIRGKLEKVVFEEEPVSEIVPIKRIPTEEEYRNGKMVRYLRQNVRTKKIDEVATIPQSYSETEYTYKAVDWVLLGPLNDRDLWIGNRRLVIEGTRTKNRKTIEETEKLLPGLSSSGILSDPEEFVKEMN